MTSSRRSFLLFSVGLTVLPGQDDVPLFRTGVSLVKVDAQIRDASGADIAGLEAADFVIFDEGEPQKIVDFAHESDPVAVMLVLDVSPSMRRSLGDLAQSAGQALDRLRPGDRAGALLFAERTRLLQPLTSEIKGLPQQIIGTVFRDELGRVTFVNEALIAAAEAFGPREESGRRAIIVVTDNETQRGSATEDAAVRAVHSADAVVNTILIDGSSEPRLLPARLESPHPDLRRISKATGGQVFTGGEPARALDSLLRSALTRYTLQYAAPPAEAGALRRIRVDLTPSARKRYPDATVVARTEYRALPYEK